MTTTAPNRVTPDPSVSPSTSDSPTGLSHRQILVVMSGLMLGMLLAALDQTIVSTALPTIAGDFGRPDLYTWVVTSYLLTSTASTPLYGKVSDLFGRKKVFQTAIVIFLLGSVLCGVSQSMWQLVIFRGVQGLGAGGLLSLAMAIVGDVIPPAQRGRYQGYFGAVFGASSVLGPLIGGFFTQHASWRFVFYVNLPLGLVALLVTNRVLKLNFNRRRASIDFFGSALLVLGVCLLLLGVQDAGRDAAITATSLTYLLVGVAVLVAFVVWETRAAEPVLPLALFRNDVFRVSSILSLVTGAVMFGAIVFLPQYMQIVKGSSPTTAGLKLLPLLCGVLLTSIGSGRLISKHGGYKKYVVTGTGLLAVGMIWISFLKADTPYVELGAMCFIIGAGLGLFMQTLVLASQNAVEMKDLGVATSGVAFFRTMGGAIGASLLGALLIAHQRTEFSAIPGAGSLSNSNDVSVTAIKNLPPAAVDIIRRVFTESMTYAYKFTIPVTILAFLISFALKEVRLRSTSGVGNSKAEAPGSGAAPSAGTLECRVPR